MMRNDFLANVAIIFFGMVLAGVCYAGSEKRAAAKADAWLGRDASELLLQLRVDGGRVQINESEDSDETSYTWETWNSEYTEKVVTGVDRQIIGMTQGGNGVAATPIFNETVYTQDVYHPATHRCDITFYADAEGIIRRWAYVGNACRYDIAKPKK